MKILNCTIHNLTQSQIADGAIEPSEEIKNQIKEILLVNGIPTRKELMQRAEKFAKLAKLAISDYKDDEIKILIGSGTPSIQPYIFQELESIGIKFVYSHSDRVCKEVHNTDGSVSKTFIFEHKGWY